MNDDKSCHGCAHEAADPCKSDDTHIPSGENACINCIRNPFFPKIKRDHFIAIDDLRKSMHEVAEKENQKREQRKPEKVNFT